MELTKKERSYFRVAQILSEGSDHKQKLGCIIVDKHRIISSACNSNTKCHRLQADLDRKILRCESTGKLHAEVAALIPLLRYRMDLSTATLYTYRQYNDGSPAMARPCPRCMELIKECGIKRIKYTTADGYASEILTT